MIITAIIILENNISRCTRMISLGTMMAVAHTAVRPHAPGVFHGRGHGQHRQDHHQIQDAKKRQPEKSPDVPRPEQEQRMEHIESLIEHVPEIPGVDRHKKFVRLVAHGLDNGVPGRRIFCPVGPHPPKIIPWPDQIKHSCSYFYFVSTACTSFLGRAQK